MPGRYTKAGLITSERSILDALLDSNQALCTDVPMIDPRTEAPNPIGEQILGLYRSPTARKAVIADIETLAAFEAKRIAIPSFVEAGPRAGLSYNPHRVRAAIVTTGGLAPGLNCVIHSIVKRHCNTYSLDFQGKVFGVYNSFKGLVNLAHNLVELTPHETEDWLDQGGSKLGSVRYYHDDTPDEQTKETMVRLISASLRNNQIDILYVIGGDGSLDMAHRIADANPSLSIAGIPKTMDNDILWVWQSFGFNTAVEQATRVINTLRGEAESTRRICIVELFGAESGFVAANAALASGHVDLVLIPEVFRLLNAEQAQDYLHAALNYLERKVQSEPHDPHAVVVVAEGVGKALGEIGAVLSGAQVTKDNFTGLLKKAMRDHVKDAYGEAMEVFENQPRHYIRAVPANSHDQIYCERLGALAVDNALAGYTNFMVSQWLTEFVLVPLRLMTGQKGIPVNGMFWKQV